jgi:hypothetical protein
MEERDDDKLTVDADAEAAIWVEAKGTTEKRERAQGFEGREKKY